MPTTIDVDSLANVTGGAPKPIKGENGDMDYCDALDTRWMAYRELDMKKQQRTVEARADRCWAVWLDKFDKAVPRQR